MKGTSLRSLNLNETGVTGASVKHLAALPNVSVINVRETEVTSEDVDAAKTIRGEGERLNIYK